MFPVIFMSAVFSSCTPDPNRSLLKVCLHTTDWIRCKKQLVWHLPFWILSYRASFTFTFQSLVTARKTACERQLSHVEWRLIIVGGIATSGIITWPTTLTHRSNWSSKQSLTHNSITSHKHLQMALTTSLVLIMLREVSFLAYFTFSTQYCVRDRLIDDVFRKPVCLPACSLAGFGSPSPL